LSKNCTAASQLPPLLLSASTTLGLSSFELASAAFSSAAPAASIATSSSSSAENSASFKDSFSAVLAELLVGVDAFFLGDFTFA